MGIDRRQFLAEAAGLLALSAVGPTGVALGAPVSAKDPKVDEAVKRGLDFLAREQRRQGYWEATGGQYRVAMTALAGNALACEGSTTTRGKYAENIKLAVDYLIELANPEYGPDRLQPRLPLHLRPRLFDALSFADLRRGRGCPAATRIFAGCSPRRSNSASGANAGRRLGLRFPEGPARFRRRLDLRHAGAGAPRPAATREFPVPQGIDRTRPSNTSSAARLPTVACSTASAAAAPGRRSRRPPLPASSTRASTTPRIREEAARLLREERLARQLGRPATSATGTTPTITISQVMYRLGDEKWSKYFDNVSKEIVLQTIGVGGMEGRPVRPRLPDLDQPHDPADR